jgi:hypothetical protein
MWANGVKIKLATTARRGIGMKDTKISSMKTKDKSK